LKNKLNNPIINNEQINFKNLAKFIFKHLRQLIKYCLYFYLFYLLSFFFGSKSFTSKVSFYTNYSTSETLGFAPIAIPLSLSESQLRFDVGNYINSDRFLIEVCKREYDFNGQTLTLADKWGANYNNYRISLMPHALFLKWSANQMWTSETTDQQKKLHFATTYLRSKMEYSEDRKSDLKTLTITLPTYSSLPKQILDVMVEDIISYSNEISSIKSSEKITFLNQRREEVQLDLLNAENTFLNFLEKNKQLSSPALQVEKDRLSRDVTLLSQILYQVSLQIESEKAKIADESSSVFLLDKAQNPARRSGVSLAKGLFYYTLLISFIFYGYKLFINRKELIK